jgi:hypothetical protein
MQSVLPLHAQRKLLGTLRVLPATHLTLIERPPHADPRTRTPAQYLHAVYVEGL